MDFKIFCFLGLLAAPVMSLLGRNPYKPGVYKIDQFSLSPDKDGSPLRSTVYYPLASGSFSIIVFLGGMHAFIGSKVYAELLQLITSHGFIVVGVDRIPLPPADPYEHLLPEKSLEDKDLGLFNAKNEPEPGVDIFLEQFRWLRQNINNRTKAVPNWNHAALMCHSAGCDNTLLMINKTRNLVKGSIFFDPVSDHVQDLEPIKDDIRIVASMSQRSGQFPHCCIAGMGYKVFYEKFTSTKVKMEIKDFGHCDVLDHLYWRGCHLVHVCVTTNDTKIEEYKNFLAGVATGFMQWAVEGDRTLEKYVVDPSLMPLPLLEIAHQDKKREKTLFIEYV